MKYSLEFLINHCKNSFELAEKKQSKLTNDILNMEGMSGNKTRHFYNNICNLDNVNYLEIGTWMGSSFISATYKNNINSIVIDNWAEFNGPKDIFFSNVKKFCGEVPLNFIESDCFKLDINTIKEKIGNIDIYMYDGNHSQESHKKAITYYYPIMSKYSIIIIDDFSYPTVYNGTYEGITESGLIIHEKFVLETYSEKGGKDTWWNGIGVFVCEKIN